MVAMISGDSLGSDDDYDVNSYNNDYNDRIGR